MAATKNPCMEDGFEEIKLKTSPSHRVRSETFQLVQSIGDDYSKSKRAVLCVLGLCGVVSVLNLATSIAANEMTQTVRTSSASAAASLTEAVVLDNGHGSAVGTHATVREASLSGCDAIEELQYAEQITVQTDAARFVGRIAGVVTVPTQLSACGYLAIVRTMDSLYDVTVLDDDVALIPKADADFAVQAAYISGAAAVPNSRRRQTLSEDGYTLQSSSYSKLGSVQTSECQETKSAFKKSLPEEREKALQDAVLPWAAAEYILHGGPSMCETTTGPPALPVIKEGSCDLSDLQLSKIAVFLDATDESSLYSETDVDDDAGCSLKTDGKPSYAPATIIPSQCPDEVKALISMANSATAGQNIAVNKAAAAEIRELLQDQTILDELELGRKLLAPCGVFVNIGSDGGIGFSVDLVCVVKKVWGFIRRLFGRRRNRQAPQMQ